MNDKQGKKARRREVLQALVGVMVGMFVAMTSLTIVGTSLPTMIKELHGSQTAYTWVITASMLSSTIATVTSPVNAANTTATSAPPSPSPPSPAPWAARARARA